MQLVFTDTSHDQELLSYMSTGGVDDVRLAVLTNGNLLIQIDGDAEQSSAIDYHTLADGAKHTISVTWDATGGTWEVHVDGTIADSGTGLATGATLAAGGTLVVGQDQDTVGGGFQSGQYFEGTLYDLRIFDDVRTGAEIAAGHGVELRHDEPGLLAAWDFQQLSTTGVVAEVVAGNSFTIAHAAGAGYTPSAPALTLEVTEAAGDGAVVGTVSGSDPDRDALIAGLLAADPDLHYSEETGKFYKTVGTSEKWSDALTRATTTTLEGVAGQLVTIRSAEENALVDSIRAASFGTAWIWLGASDVDAEGVWRWYDGATAGDTFWNGAIDGEPVGDQYVNWHVDDPNDNGSGEHVAVLAEGTWRDNRDSAFMRSIIEWDADAVLAGSQSLTYSITSQTVDGAFSVDPNTGVVTVADASLLDYATASSHDLTIEVSDVDGGSYTEVAVVELTHVPGTVVAFDDAITTDQGTPITFDPLANDLGSGLTIVEVGRPTNGTAVDNGDGTITYTPNLGFSGSDSFEYEAVATDLGLQHYWGLDGGAHDSVGSSEGTVHGATTVAGDFGNALAFDESDAYVEIPDVGYAAEFSISFDFKLDDNSGSLFQYLYSHGDVDGTNSLNVFVVEDAHGTDPNVLRTVVRDGDDTLDNFALQFDISGIVGDGQWHTYTVTVGAGGVEVFLDGVSRASDATRGTDGVDPTGAVHLGARHDLDAPRFLGGAMDSLAIYGTALSPDQIASLAGDGDRATVSVTVDATADAPTDIVFDTESTGETRVNAYATDRQLDPAIAAFADGSAIVVWSSENQDGSGFGIYGRRLDAEGAPVGGDILIASETTDSETGPSVTTFPDGGFVVTWQDQTSGVNAWTEARVFDADGTPAGSEFRVSPGLDGDNEGYQPAVVALGNDEFVVVWANETGGATHEVAGQIYDRSGIAVGTQLSVGSLAGGQGLFGAQVEVDRLDDGGFVASWRTYDGVTFGARARVMNADGTARSAEILLPGDNVTGIAGLASGGFVVTYDAGGQLEATIFDASGNSVVAGISVNTTTSASRYESAVTRSDDGFVVVWESSTGDGSGSAILAQRFDAAGSRVGSETLVNETAGGDQLRPDVVETASGQILAVWESDGVDGSFSAIVSRVLATATAEVAEGAATGTRVVDVIGVLDLDSPDGHTFALVDDAGGRFAIDPSSGTVTVLDGAAIDFETATSHRITVRATDTMGATYDEDVEIAVTDVSDPPAIDLDADDSAAPGVDFATTWTQGGGSVLVADTDASVSDADSPTLSSMTVTITNAFDGVSELLAADTAGTAITASYDAATNVLTLSGTDTVENYELVLRAVTYDNTASNPNTVARSIEVVASDESGPGQPAVSTVAIASGASSGLVGHYQLDEGSGTVAVDSSVFGWDGAHAGSENPGHVEGRVGTGALDFSGDFDTVVIPDAPDGHLDFGAGDFTVGFWLNSSQIPATSTRLVGKMDLGGGPGFVFFTNGSGNVSLQVSDGSSLVVLSAGGALDGDWHQITGLRDGNRFELYVDGTLVDSATQTIGSIDNGAAVVMGASSSDYDGRLDDLRLYDLALEPADVGTLARPPLVDLDADDSTALGTSSTGSWVEDAGPVLIADLDAILTDADDGDLSTLTIRIENLQDAGLELLLTADTTGTNIAAAWDSGTGTLTLSGTDTVTRYQQVLRTVAYDNASDTPSLVDREISVVAHDGTSAGNVATAVLSIAATNDDPVAVDDAAIVNAGGTIVLDLAVNDTDPDDGIDPTTVAILSGPSSGSVVVNGDGTVTYTHDGSATSADAFTYTIRDATGAVSSAATVDVTIQPMDASPTILAPATGSTTEDTSLVFSSATSNAIVIEDDAGEALRVRLSVSNGTLTLPTVSGLVFVTGTNGGADFTFEGTVEDVNTALDGLTYLPALDYSGADTLQLDVNDADLLVLDLDPGLLGKYTFNAQGNLGKDTSPDGGNDGTLVGGITGVNDDPVRDEVIELDGSGDAIVVDGLLGEPTSVTLAGWVRLDAATSDGAHLISLGDSVVLALDRSDAGEGVQGFFYDGADWNSTASGTFIAGTGWHHVAYTIDGAADVQTLYLDGVVVAQTSYTSTISYTNGTDTVIGAHGDGSADFDLDGRIDDIRIYDHVLSASEIGVLQDAPAQPFVGRSIALTIDPENDPPMATDDSGTVAEGGTVTLDLAGNDSDADDGLDLTSIEMVSGPSNGSVVVNADGTVDYTHDGSETTVDSFTYTIRDASGQVSNTATVTLGVTPVNDPPVATDDSGTVAEGGTVTLDLAGNDSDADDGLGLASIEMVSGPSNGSVVVNADGTVDYTHDGSETTGDSFTYTIRTRAGRCRTRRR